MICIVRWWINCRAIRIDTMLSGAGWILATLACQLLARAYAAVGSAKFMLPDNGAEISPCLRLLTSVALVLLFELLVASGYRLAPYTLQAYIVGLHTSRNFAHLLVVEC